MCATFWCLLLNGFVGYQFLEDGTQLSLWLIRLASLGVGVVTGLIALGTFKSMVGLNPENPVALWIAYYIFNGASLVIYVILQIVLVITKLEDRWPLGK
jgi:hypothetical protein